MKRKLVAAIAAVVVVMMMAPAASAHTGAPYRLRRFASGDAAIRWQRGTVDSPLDANKARLLLEVAAQSGDDYALAWERGSGVRRPISSVRNLSFDFHSGAYVGAGAPRITIEIDEDANGVTDFYVYLSALYCNNPIGTSIWHRADFTGERGVGTCLFYTSEAGSPTYASDGNQSAWDTFVDAHGGLDRVHDAYVVMDEVGVSYIDRVALHNHMFPRSPYDVGYIVHCPTEASC